jgi:tRNA(fMet)-specific endonuclease VapC
MTRFLFDTGKAGDYIDHRSGVFERAHEEVARGNRVGICVPVLAELWYGVELSSTRDRNSQQLRRALPSLKVWPFTEQAGEEYGRICAHLKRIGRPIGRIDIQIAAIATDRIAFRSAAVVWLAMTVPPDPHGTSAPIMCARWPPVT